MGWDGMDGWMDPVREQLRTSKPFTESGHESCTGFNSKVPGVEARSRALQPKRTNGCAIYPIHIHAEYKI